MTTLLRPAKTFRDIPEEIQLKLSATHDEINLKLKTLLFQIRVCMEFSAQTLGSWTAKNNFQTQV